MGRWNSRIHGDRRLGAGGPGIPAYIAHRATFGHLAGKLAMYMPDIRRVMDCSVGGRNWDVVLAGS